MNAAGETTQESRAFKRRTGVSPSITNLTVQFVTTSPLQLQIKHVNTMKTSPLIQNKPVIPSLFYIASRIEDFASATISESAPPLSETPFADLMLHPEKLEAALKTAKSENDAFDAARGFSQNPAKRPTRRAAPENGYSNSVGRPSNQSLA
jgi:hypothetical protein